MEPENPPEPTPEQLREAEDFCRQAIEKANSSELATVITYIADSDSSFCQNFDLARTLDVVSRIMESKNPAGITMPGNELGRDIGEVDTKYGLRDRLRV